MSPAGSLEVAVVAPIRFALAVVLASGFVLSTGCASSRRAVVSAGEDEPFFCQPEFPKVEPKLVPVVPLPSGKLDVACQPEAHAALPKEEDGETEPSEQQRFLARRCRLVAQAVPLVDVAIALSAATGYDVSVQPEVMALRVGVSMREVTLREFVDALSSESGRVTLSMSGRTARFGWREAGSSFGCGEALLVRLLPIPEGVPGRQLASTVCRNLLSSNGRVSLIGRQLYVADVRANQERLDAFLRFLGQKAP